MNEFSLSDSFLNPCDGWLCFPATDCQDWLLHWRCWIARHNLTSFFHHVGSLNRVTRVRTREVDTARSLLEKKNANYPFSAEAQCDEGHWQCKQLRTFSPISSCCRKVNEDLQLILSTAEDGSMSILVVITMPQILRSFARSFVTVIEIFPHRKRNVIQFSWL